MWTGDWLNEHDKTFSVVLLDTSRWNLLVKHFGLAKNLFKFSMLSYRETQVNCLANLILGLLDEKHLDILSSYDYIW